MRFNVFSKTKGEESSNKELDNFIQIILKINSKEQMEDFLKGILTPKELLEIPNRLEIIKMLKKGIAHHDVAGKLGVGIATVTRGSKELQKGRFENV
jgi:TrpR family transcriptional regulator, trp operon repressor